MTSEMKLYPEEQFGPLVPVVTFRSVDDALRVFTIRSLLAAKQTPASTGILNDVLGNRRSSFLSTDFLF